MASNPMQAKARNSFILGVFVALIIFSVIAIGLYVLVLNPNKSKNNGKPFTAYVLNTDVKSGQPITTKMLTPIEVYQNMVPKNYVDTELLARIISEDTESTIISRVELNKNTVLTRSVILRSESAKTQASTRYVEYNMLTLGTTVTAGDFVDVRVTFPNGQDLIVIAKKEIKDINGSTVGFELTEEEIAMMRSAIVEAYIMKASNLYVAKYISAGEQAEAIKTYVPTLAVQDLIKNNPNIESEARDALESRFDENLRRYIDDNRNSYAIEEKENLEAGIAQEIQNAKAAREAYLTGLNPVSTTNTADTTNTTNTTKK